MAGGCSAGLGERRAGERGRLHAQQQTACLQACMLMLCRTRVHAHTCVARPLQQTPKVQREHHLPAGDFPDVSRFRDILAAFDLSTFPKLSKSMVKQVGARRARGARSLVQKDYSQRTSIAALTPCMQQPARRGRATPAHSVHAGTRSWSRLLICLPGRLAACPPARHARLTTCCPLTCPTWCANLTTPTNDVMVS